ncbi:MBL fold metallo-hydrolase [Actinoplanes sp. CA-030573]|uniref:MBL fold metallo-hydrolase n=1 Tax=Actinoplanes sp. CA-030573 TaxID=3239898 RepID=UPI003D8D3E6F
MSLAIRSFGGPTVQFTLGGVTFMTDPTFDEPGDYPIGDRKLTRTAPPLLPRPAAGTIDVVLLSHDQHPDNLDRAGREFSATVPLVLSTPAAAERISARGLATWEVIDLDGGVTVTAVPAQHGPDGVEHLVGPVTGFVLQGKGLPTVYVSGDNASLRVVAGIAERFPSIDVAILFGGAARTKLVGDANLTLDAAGMVQAARILRAGEVHAAHIDSWAHFTEGPEDVRKAFTAAGLPDPTRP